MSVSNKQFFEPIIAANQVLFIITIKYTVSELSGIIVSTDISLVKGNGIGSNSRVRIVSIMEVDIISITNIGISFNSTNSVGSNMEIDTSSNLGDVVFCLGILSAIAIGLTFS